LGFDDKGVPDVAGARAEKTQRNCCEVPANDILCYQVCYLDAWPERLIKPVFGSRMVAALATVSLGTFSRGSGFAVSGAWFCRLQRVEETRFQLA
jgi:hypothetical protein